MAKVRTRKRGKTYSYIFEAGTVDGKRKVIEKGGFPSADDAYNAGVEAYTDFKHGNIGITKERIPLKEFMQLWLNRVKKDIRQSTFDSYQMIVRAKIIPGLGDVVIQDLRPAHVDRWFQDMQDIGNSKGYIRQCRMVLKAALDYAVYPCELLPSNPCLYARVPRKAACGALGRVLVDDSRFRVLLYTFPLGDALHAALALMWHTGMRIGEVLGLTWEDVDFNARCITVRRQRIYRKDTPKTCGSVITEPKTEQSCRVVYVTDELLDELKKEKARQENLKIINAVDKDGYCYSFSKGLKLRADLSRVHLVCVNKTGRPASRQTIMRQLKLLGLNSHSFRHTHATRLAAAGVPPVTAARRLGHKKPDTTLNVYTHDTEKMQKQAVSALEIAEWDKFFST